MPDSSKTPPLGATQSPARRLRMRARGEKGKPLRMRVEDILSVRVVASAVGPQASVVGHPPPEK